MKRELLIECSPDLIRAAVLEDGKLCEIHREHVHEKKLTESLFLGCVKSIRPSVGAAFVDIGESLNAFLPLHEGREVKCGDMLIVQGTAVQAVETKGLRISDTINLAGKWLVLVPGAQGVRISKKIKDPQLRTTLQDLVEPLCPKDCGLIVRTASEDVTQLSLQEEVLVLEERWKEIRRKAAGMTKPGLLYEPLGLAAQLIRDIGGTLSRVVTNDQKCLQALLQAKQHGWLCEDALIEHFDESKRLLNDVYSLDSQIDKALKRRVWLNCGGYLVFDICEALTVIDVNSGKILGHNAEDTALQVNLEAAVEVARQLRLRDIGGIVVVDYIDMCRSENRDKLLAQVKLEVRKDRSQVVVGDLTRFGLLEMTRKRKGQQLDRTLQTGCKVCAGQGKLLSSEETAFRALRQVKRMSISGQRGPFLIRCSAHVLSVLSEFSAPDSQHDVYMSSEAGKHGEWFEINQMDVSALMPKGTVQMKKG